MREIVSLVAATAALAVGTPASAATLLDVTNMPTQFVTPESFTFTADSASTAINFQGYQLPGTLAVVNIFFGATGSTTNLLGLNFTGTASGCSAPFNTFGQGSVSAVTGVHDLTFGGTCEGSYDTLSQIVNTTIGASYTLNFSFTNVGQGGNGLRVSTGALPAGAVPEPATWAMMLLGFGGMGFALRRTRKRNLAQLA